jgi:antitoxin FitA
MTGFESSLRRAALSHSCIARRRLSRPLVTIARSAAIQAREFRSFDWGRRRPSSTAAGELRRHDAVAAKGSLRTVDMLPACNYLVAMRTLVRLHVPDDLRRKLEIRAAMEGLSLADYLLQELRRVAELPTLGELRDRLARRTRVASRIPPVKAVRAERDRK